MIENSIKDVDSLYQEILGRAPDTGGLEYWAQQFGNTVDPTEIEQFRQAAAPELAAKNAAAPLSSLSPNNQTSVSDLYQQILGRAPDEGGLEYWKQQFGDTIDPNEMEQFKQAASPELALSPLNPMPYPESLVPAMPKYDGQEEPLREIGVPPQRDFFSIDPINPGYDRLQNPFPERRDYPSRFQGPLMERIDYPKMAAPTNINSVYDLFQQILGRAPDDAGLTYWKQQFGDTIDPNEIAQFVEAAKTELDLLPLNPAPYPIIDLIGIPDISSYPTTRANRFPVEDPIYKLYKDVLGR